MCNTFWLLCHYGVAWTCRYGIFFSAEARAHTSHASYCIVLFYAVTLPAHCSNLVASSYMSSDRNLENNNNFRMYIELAPVDVFCILGQEFCCVANTAHGRMENGKIFIQDLVTTRMTFDLNL